VHNVRQDALVQVGRLPVRKLAFGILSGLQADRHRLHLVARGQQV